MKNLIKKIVVICICVLAIHSAKSYGVRVVNNAPCDVYVNVFNSFGVSIASGWATTGATTWIACNVTQTPVSIDFTELGTCIFQLAVPGSGSCASCSCACIDTSRTFSATYTSASLCNLGLDITVN